jgi:membrane fusion protein (multidrug efflux system)
VDVKTGAIRLAGLLPNPGNSLRPGLYAKVRTAVRVQQGALLVPQRAIIDLQGTRLIAVVDGNDTVNVHAIKLGETVGSDWIVDDGVKPSERVIVEGVQKVRNGMKVSPKPYVQILH